MYKELKKSEIKEFVKKYFSVWGDDIGKVTVVCYGDFNEYLINDGVLFLEKIV